MPNKVNGRLTARQKHRQNSTEVSSAPETGTPDDISTAQEVLDQLAQLDTATATPTLESMSRSIKEILGVLLNLTKEIGVQTQVNKDLLQENQKQTEKIGFWLKSESYREQPEVRFKHEYLLVVETDSPELPVICTTFAQLRHLVSHLRDCSMVKSRESDNNRDGKNDELFIELEVPLENTDHVHTVKLFLLFDYRLYKLSSLVMDSMGFIEHSSSLPGARLDVFADLRLVQKSLLASRGRNLQHNRTIVDGAAISRGDFELRTLLRDYAARNVSTRLQNVYPLWTSGRAADEPFVVTATVFYPEDDVAYRPGFWQVLKWAWMQYFALLVIVAFAMQRVSAYVFRNQLVVSMRVDPWRNVKP